MKYPFRIDMISNDVVWKVLIKSKKDLEYFKQSGYRKV